MFVLINNLEFVMGKFCLIFVEYGFGVLIGIDFLDELIGFILKEYNFVNYIINVFG